MHIALYTDSQIKNRSHENKFWYKKKIKLKITDCQPFEKTQLSKVLSKKTEGGQCHWLSSVIKSISSG